MKRKFRLTLVALALVTALAGLSLCAAGAEGARFNVRDISQPGQLGAGDRSLMPIIASLEPIDYPQQEDIDLSVREEKSLTLMVYMCGSNLESDYGSASMDILEMAASDFNTDEVNVLVFTGGATQWSIPGIPVEKRSVWAVDPAGFYAGVSPDANANYTVQQLFGYTRDAMSPALLSEVTSMGEPATLSEFLEFAYTYYPASRYALILWNHGGGPNFGVCMDSLFHDDSISTSELTNGLKSSPFAEEPLEWIGFDACLMGSAEIARQVAPYARYMIASEETEPGSGWNYDFLWGIENDATGADTARRIIDLYVDELASASSRFKVTMSCLDLSKMDALSEASSDVFGELNGLLTAATYVDFAKVRESGAFFGHADDAERSNDYDLVDFGSFVANLDQGSEASRQALMNAIDDAVVYTRSTIDNATGLSVYYPHFNTRLYGYISGNYSGISLSDSYSDFVNRYVDIQNSPAYVDWSNLATVAGLSNRDVRSVLSLQLTPQQIEFLASAQLAVFERDGEGYALVSVVPDVEISESTLSAEYQHRALFIVDESGEPLSPGLPYTALGENQFSAEVELVAYDAAGSEARRQKAQIHFSILDDAGEIEITEVLGYDEAQDSYLQRYGISLGDFDAMELTREVRSPVVFAGNTLKSWNEWTPVSETLCVCHGDAGQRLMMLHDKLDHDRLFGSFALRDFQNNRFLSELSALSAYRNRRGDEIVLTYDDAKLLLLSGPMFTMGEGTSAVLSMDVKNISDQEVIIVMDGVALNGEATELTTEVYGFGENYGLEPQEQERLVLFIPAANLEGIEAMDTIEFELALLEPTGEVELGRVPVKLSLNQALAGEDA